MALPNVLFYFLLYQLIIIGTYSLITPSFTNSTTEYYSNSDLGVFGNDISRALATFVEVAGKYESHQAAYIDPEMDEMRDIQKLVGETAQVISDSYSQVIRLSRRFLFAKIAELSENMMGFHAT